LLSYLGLTLISISINAGQLTIVVSGRFTLALVTNHNGQYLINTPCHAKTVSTAMEDIIRAVLSKLGLTLISASINKGSLIIVCRKDTAVPPPLNAYQRGNAVMSVMFTYAYQRGNALVSILTTPVLSMLTSVLVSNMPTLLIVNMTTVCFVNMMFYAYQRGKALLLPLAISRIIILNSMTKLSLECRCCLGTVMVQGLITAAFGSLSVVHAHLGTYTLGTCQDYMWCLGQCSNACVVMKCVCEVIIIV